MASQGAAKYPSLQGFMEELLNRQEDYYHALRPHERDAAREGLRNVLEYVRPELVDDNALDKYIATMLDSLINQHEQRSRN
jgi:hypothetical protein